MWPKAPSKTLRGWLKRKVLRRNCIRDKSQLFFSLAVDHWELIFKFLRFTDIVSLSQSCRYGYFLAHTVPVQAVDVWLRGFPREVEAILTVWSNCRFILEPATRTLGGIELQEWQRIAQMPCVVGFEISRKTIEPEDEAQLQQLMAPVGTIIAEACPFIESIEAFAHCFRVNLALHPLLQNVQALASVPHINLTHCTNITDVACLASATSLVLRGCLRVSDVSALGNVQFLDLTNCVGVHDVSALGTNEERERAGASGVFVLRACGKEEGNCF
eukprot:m.104420 g.104420  ORF g.104420 m.104420 type:complete len:273 (-) comp13259_c0_seq9:138-956(-)